MIKGFFGFTSFKKVEMYAITSPQESNPIHEKLKDIAVEFYKLLEIPFRVVNLCAGDVSLHLAKTYDIELWFPGQNRFRELASISNAVDYQSRRYSIKYKKVEGGKVEGFVHTLNGTVVASPRILAAIVEHNQQEDGTIKIPKVLIPYTKFDRINTIKA